MPHANQTSQQCERSRELIHHEGILCRELILSGTNVGGQGCLYGVDLGVDCILGVFQCCIDVTLGLGECCFNFGFGGVEIGVDFVLTTLGVLFELL